MNKFFWLTQYCLYNFYVEMVIENFKLNFKKWLVIFKVFYILQIWLNEMVYENINVVN